MARCRNDEGRVAELSLSSNQLTGEIPTALGDLSNLTHFNQLNGEILDLSNLQRLLLSSNQLTGELGNGV